MNYVTISTLCYQIKYTAYSGWISSGLVSWTIDKVAIIDSFSKILSVCKKGLILESGRSIYLPLYPGECNIPLDTDNSTASAAVPALERVAMEDRQGGIGPFTKEQNYETKDPEYSVEILPADRMSQKRSFGPFTKEQNRRVVEVETVFEDAEKRRNVANPWIVLDISGDGDSNSLENAESEQGRSFSGAANLIYRASTERVTETTVTTTTELLLPEIREPVLRPSKKDAGRSLKLPEITEPILHPRATRHNTRNEVVPQHQQHHGERQRDEIQETSSTSTRAFTVQFLPERLAGILAQAERYARQTLLPLISQYTPSFVTGIRQEEPKYFPLLSNIVRPRSADSTETSKTTDRQRNSDQISRVVISQRKTDKLFSIEDGRYESTSSAQTENDKNEYTVPKAEVSPMIVEAVYPEKIANANSTGLEMKTASENSDWLPIGEPATTLKNSLSRRDSNVSRSLDWSIDNNRDWTVNANAEAEVKPDEWIPITVQSDAVSTTSQTTTSSEKTVATTMKIDTVDNSWKSTEDNDKTKEEITTIANTYERKFIPLVDLDATTSSPPLSTNVNDASDSTTVSSHIQKIPRYKTTVKSARTIINPTMMFPYAYERKNDPRTRYIPLIPEEDMGKAYPMSERDR